MRELNQEELADEANMRAVDMIEDDSEEDLSECCGATILDEIGLCSDCKEHC